MHLSFNHTPDNRWSATWYVCCGSRSVEKEDLEEILCHLEQLLEISQVLYHSSNWFNVHESNTSLLVSSQKDGKSQDTQGSEGPAS
jgi:hypothetical protein